MKKDRTQANQYDKIVKENIEAVIPSLMLNVLGITAVFMEELPDDRGGGPHSVYKRA